jgi:putative FmdB family regulatory protein
MAQNRSQARRERPRPGWITLGKESADGGGDNPLHGVADENHRRRSAAESPENIGGSGIAAANLVDVDPVHSTHHDSEIDAADEVWDDQDRDPGKLRHWKRPDTEPKSTAGVIRGMTAGQQGLTFESTRLEVCLTVPTYEYRCEKCSESFEIFQSFSDRPLRKHAGCGGPVEKVFHPRGITFKGSGFYVTDSRSKNGSSDSSTSKEESSSPVKTEESPSAPATSD